MSRRINGEGTIFKRKDGRWCAAYYDNNEKRHYVYGRTQKEVSEKLYKKREDDLLEQHDDYLLKDWIEMYLVNYKKNEIKITTFGTYMMMYQKHICESDIGSILLSKLKPNDLQKFYNKKIEEGYSSKTVRHIEVIINCALKQAVNEKMITENPNDFTILPKRKAYQACFLTADEVRIIVENAKEEEIYPIVMIALFTGMRKGEIMGLTWKNSIDFENNMIHVVGSLCRIVHNDNQGGKTYATYEILEPKTQKSIRNIPMNDLVKNVLIEQKGRQDREKAKYKDIYVDNDLVFARSDGRYLNQRKFMNKYHDFLKRYGIRDCRFHDLRHSFASLLLESGTDMKVTSELLGHSTISTSMDIYSHVYEGAKIRALGDLKNIIMLDK